VFVFEEIASINALAAGSRPEDAAVAVTAGCLENLTREELQGVIAHEFSHILNGGMRLNLKMVSMLGPIMSMSAKCKACFMGLDPETDGWSERLTARVGYVYGLAGSFLGRLIQCLISREREYLADAAAVQFTRNPAGLASALKKIARQKASPALTSQEAMLASHMFFSAIDASRFSTHPPISERIRRIDPSLGGRGLAEVKAHDASLSDVMAPNQVPGAVLDFENKKAPDRRASSISVRRASRPVNACSPHCRASCASSSTTPWAPSPWSAPCS
jgi:Zn-dependent protease with chaperone function